MAAIKDLFILIIELTSILHRFEYAILIILTLPFLSYLSLFKSMCKKVYEAQYRMLYDSYLQPLVLDHFDKKIEKIKICQPKFF